MKQVYHAANFLDAQMAVDLLASEGIAAHLQGGFLTGAAGELPAGELLRVWVVEDEDVARARALLASRDRHASVEEGALDPLLVRSWERAWSGLGAVGTGTEVRDALLASWASEGRRYHTLRHLHDCLATLEPVLAQAEHAAEVEMALWFHDAIYDPRAKDNELRSAQWAQRALAGAGVAAEACSRVHALVMATLHEAVPETRDAGLLVDVDLSILGAPRERFDEYETEVREEYAWVPGPVFRHKRREILRQFQARESIYSSQAFRSALESRARDNLAHAVERLRPWWRW